MIAVFASIEITIKGVTLTSLTAKICNLMLLFRIRPDVSPIIRNNAFRINRSIPDIF